ncbi:DUF4157 domain-containing protein [Micromonospora sp. NPDC005806]|uniref:eCIS core domain-containing protein n=1 Tax=Micromonospora sp. NPDC005806 TaxID=3364234 RepID=UPI0036C07040
MASEAARIQQGPSPAPAPIEEPARASAAPAQAAADPIWVRIRDGDASAGPALRAMSGPFGQSFDGVTLDDDPRADAEARERHAAAFTDRERIGFAAGRFEPWTRAGAFTLAHELAHVVQLRSGVGDRPHALLEADADRAANDVLAGRRPQIAAGGSGPSPDMVLRQDADAAKNEPAADKSEWQPVVRSGGIADNQPFLLRYIMRNNPDVPADRIGLFFFAGKSLELYIGDKHRATMTLAESSAPVPAGIYAAGSGGHADQLYQRRTADGKVTYDWFAVPVTDPDRSTLDQVIPAQVEQYKAIARETKILWYVRTQSTGTGTGEGGGGGKTTEGEGGGPAGEGGTPLPQWATDMHRGLVARLNREQARIKETAQQTVQDTEPKTLQRLYSFEGIPKALALGTSGERPSEQVTVDRPKDKDKPAEVSGVVPLVERDEVDDAWERIVTAARLLYANRPARPGDAEADAPMGIPGEDPADPETVAPNKAAYPSQIHNYGPPIGVVGTPQHFAMELNWSIEGQWGVFGPMALRGYHWRIFRIRDKTGTDVREEGRKVGVGEGPGAVIRHGFGDIGEDLDSTTIGEYAVMGDLVALDAILRGAGTLVKSYVSLVTQPQNERAVEFGAPGTYVIVCVSSQVPVKPTEDIPDPVVRAPSVATYLLRVENKKDLAQTSVEATDLKAAEAELVDLADKASAAPEEEKEQAEAEVRAQQAEIERLREADRADLPGHLSSSIATSEKQIDVLKRLIALQATGTAPATWTDFEARVTRVGLELQHIPAEEALRQVTAALDQLKVQQRMMLEVTDLKTVTYRPHVAFVPDADGRVLPVMMMLGEHTASTDRRQRWVLIDVSVPGHRDRYEGTSGRGGAAGTAEAITNAFEDFAGKIPYGRGEVGVRLPDALLDLIQGQTVPNRYRAHPDMSTRFWQRLESLATAASIAALVVSGPAGVALGVVGGLAGGAIAAHRIHQRVSGGYFEWDLQTALDVTAIVAAVLPGLGAAAGRVPAGSRFARTADWIQNGIEIYGYVQLAGTFVLIPESLYRQIKAIEDDPKLSPGEKAAKRAEAFLDSTRDMVVAAATAAQMIEHATAGPRPPRPAAPENPPVETQKPPRPPEETTPPAPIEEPKPPAQAEEPKQPRQPKPSAPAEEPKPPPEVAGQDVVRESIEEGMVLMAPEGQTLSSRVATDLFVSAAHSTPYAEVALLYNLDGGDYVVVIGNERSVRLGESNPNWQEILPERSRTGRWVMREHSHAADRTTGYVSFERRWPSGADGDFLVLVDEARATGETAVGKIRLRTPEGEQVTTYKYHPKTARPYEVDVALPGNRRYARRYANIEDYQADLAEKTGQPQGPVPEDFPGAKRGPAGPERPPAADIPEPARAPGQAEAPARTRQQELTAREKAAQDALASGNTELSSEATARLRQFQEQLAAGFEGTGFDVKQIARLLDAGVTPDQVRALRTWLGESAGAYLDRRSLSRADLEVLGRAAEQLAPLLGNPDVDAGLARMARPGGDRKVGPLKIAKRLAEVPPAKLPTLLRIFADPLFPVRGLQDRHYDLLREPNVIDLIGQYGATLWRQMNLPQDYQVREQALRALADKVAANPAGGPDLVQAVLDAKTARAMATVVELPPPQRKVSPRRGGIDLAEAPGTAEWETALLQAGEFARDHPEWLAQAMQPQRGGIPARTQAEVEALLARTYMAEARARRQYYDYLSHDDKLVLLRNFVELTRQLGWEGRLQTWANRASGAVSEGLFLPEGARPQIRLPHPGEAPNKPTIIDYELPADKRVVPDRRNFVEQKSDALSAPSSRGVDAGDVALARKYVGDARDDAPGVAAAPANTRPGFEAPGGGVHMIEFVRTPNDVTMEAMLDVLLAPDSPFEAAKFGDGPWVTKAAWQARQPVIASPR